MGKRGFMLAALGFVQSQGITGSVKAQQLFYQDDFCQIDPMAPICIDAGCTQQGGVCELVRDGLIDGQLVDGCQCSVVAHAPCASQPDATQQNQVCVDFDCAQLNPTLHCNPQTCQCEPNIVTGGCSLITGAICVDDGCAAQNPGFHCDPDLCECQLDVRDPIDECQVVQGVCTDNGCAAKPGGPFHCSPDACQCEPDDPPIDECQVDAAGVCRDNGCAAKPGGPFHCSPDACQCELDTPPIDECQLDTVGICQDNGCAANNSGFHCDPVDCQCRPDTPPIDECQLDAQGICQDNGCVANNPGFRCDPDACQCLPDDANGPTLVLDHFKCWQVKDLKIPTKFQKRNVTLDDQFVDETVEVKKLFLICTPADKDGSGINDPDAHQCCYKIKSGTKLSSTRVEVGDQFGIHTLLVQKPKFLCQPCSKTVLP